MSSNIAPIPLSEMDRILNLYDFDIDYSNLESTFKDLTHLAAKISGTDISLVNLIDSYTQWSVSNFGLDIAQMAREDSVCQYTILAEDHFEVEDLSADERFQDKSYVSNPLNLRYYFGVPLKTSTGHHIGALCVLDKQQKKLSDEKIGFLKIIANEIIAKLNAIKVVKTLKSKVEAEQDVNKKVAHDIRGPISGIIGLSDIILEESKDDETLNLVSMISKSGYAVLDLADEILNPLALKHSLDGDHFNLIDLKQRLEILFTPQAKAKQIQLTVKLNDDQKEVTFKKDKLLQIIGNLISNAIKFTPEFGCVEVALTLILNIDERSLVITVTDNGLGLNPETIQSILTGAKKTTPGTHGELGYGFGLAMVRDLVKSIGGKLDITSTLGNGAKFEITLPI